MKFRKFLALLVCFAVITSSFLSCNTDLIKLPVSEDPQKQARSFYKTGFNGYFNTACVAISYRGDSPEEFDSNCDAIEKLVIYYDKLFDIYYEYSGVNNLKTVNENAGKEPVKVDRELIDFLIYAKEIYILTDGKTNIAMGSVLKLWHDARENGIEDPESAKIPDADALNEAAKHTNINDIIINEKESTVYLADPYMTIDVGAIGKGYATEKAAELLIDRGVTSYVLNFGGNIRAIGAKVTGDGWITGITNPDTDSEESFVCRVNIKDISLVTSGDYERFYIANGEKYHHIIDPDTLMPAKYFSSVSVFTKDSGLADALSTALFCMSYEEGLALVNDIGNIDVIWVSKDGEVRYTSGVEFWNSDQ